MTPSWGPALVYSLCLTASALCAALLLRAWRQSGSRLLFWTGTAFVLLAINNLLLVADMVLFPQVDLWPARQAALLAALAVLLYGFVWGAES